jgi:hypothetical protein
MVGKRPVFTENFSVNLTAIQTLFLGLEGAHAFKRLFTHLVDDVIPTICRYPQCGRQFFVHAIRSSEARVLVKKLRRRLESSDDLREYIVKDYLLLYLVRGERIVFLAIKHHRQLSFDLKGFWQN